MHKADCAAIGHQSNVQFCFRGQFLNGNRHTHIYMDKGEVPNRFFKNKLPHVILCALVSLPGTRWQLLITDLRLSHDCPQNSQGHWVHHIPVYRHWGTGGGYRGKGTKPSHSRGEESGRVWSKTILWHVFSFRTLPLVTLTVLGTIMRKSEVCDEQLPSSAWLRH